MKINTVIFDLDGTLLNTLDDLTKCFNYSIKNFGYKERTTDEIKSFVGNGIKLAIKKAVNGEIEEEKLNEITEFFKKYYIEHMFIYTKPYDGIIPLLKELKQKGYKMAVVSNKYDDAVKNLCKNYFNEYIDIAIGEGYGIKKKPEADGVLKAIKELNSTPEQSIYIGDSDVDIKTAENAGIKCISVLWGFRDKKFLEKYNVNFFAEKPIDIIKIIEKKIYLR